MHVLAGRFRRSALLWALVLAVSPAAAYADDGIEVVMEQGGSVEDSPLVEVPSQDETTIKNDGKANDEGEKFDVFGDEKSEKTNTDKNDEEGLAKDVQRESRDDGYSLLAAGDRASVTLTAWQSVSPTSQYAQYATGLLKEVRSDEHYCFVQDSQQSYTLVVGKADSMGTFSDARWWRWYNAGVNLGWRVESGSGSATVRPQEYVVLSDLDGYSSLPDGVHEVARREVMTYALVAACLFSLAACWGFVVRFPRDG